ncbi:MAG: GNAT family N-acetyltransferase [Myxococcota bacterium]
MKPGYVFSTERLDVRRWRETDEPLIFRLYSDPDVVRWVDDGEAITWAEVTRWMNVTRQNYDKRGYGMFAIDDRKMPDTIGFGGLVHPNNQPEPEIKYAFRPAVWGRGIATEFVRGLIDYGRTTHGIDRMIATVAAENAASIRVLQRSGLQRTNSRTDEAGVRVELFARPSER